MTTRNLSLTLEQAKELYKANPDLKDLLLPSFPELDNKVVDKWEDLEVLNGYYIDDDSKIIPVRSRILIPSNKNIFATEKQAKSSLAAAQLSQLLESTGDCNVDWASLGKPKYTIHRDGNRLVGSLHRNTYYFLAFNTEAIRDEFLTKHEDLIKQYFEL